MPHPDFLVLPQSPKSTGKTYIIGDVHGEIRAFEAVLDMLTPEDTLVIVGDLIDRGQDADGNQASKYILDRLITPRETDPKVVVTKGNHEKDFLNLIELLNNEHASLEEFEERVLKTISNGAIWAFKDETDELTKNLHMYSAHYSQKTDYFKAVEKYLHNFIKDKLFPIENRFSYLAANIDVYVNYIQSMPYIIKIDDPSNPAWIAHADLPISDADLQTLVESDHPLTEAQMSAITNTRPKDFSHCRTENSIIVYCGHNILDEITKVSDDAVLSVRIPTNHVNLDCGAYVCGAFLMVNHTDKTVSIVNARSQTPAPYLLQAQNDIQEHLTTHPYVLSIQASNSDNNLANLMANLGVFASASLPDIAAETAKEDIKEAVATNHSQSHHS